MKRFLFDTWYGIVVAWAALGLLTLGTVFGLGHYSHLQWIGPLVFIIHAAFGLVVLGAVVYSLVKRRWGRAFVQFLLSVVVAGAYVFGFAVLSFTQLFSERNLKKFKETEQKWYGAEICEVLPFSVEFQPAHPFLAEYNKRVVFKSGKSVCMRMDTGGAGDFAVYALPDGNYYMVDGLDCVWIRSEYRVDAKTECIELMCGATWVRIPDDSLGISSWGATGLSVKTTFGEKSAEGGIPVGDSIKDKSYIGRITTRGEFVAGGPEPRIEMDEVTWCSSTITEDVPFAFERGESKAGKKYAHIAFKSGKTVNIMLDGGIENKNLAVYRLPDKRFLLVAREGTMWEYVYRLDVDEESVCFFKNGWMVLIPDEAIRFDGHGENDSGVYIKVVTPDGEVEIAGKEKVPYPFLGAKYVGTIAGDGSLKEIKDELFVSEMAKQATTTVDESTVVNKLAELLAELRKIDKEVQRKKIDSIQGWHVDWAGFDGNKAYRVYRSEYESCVASFALEGDKVHWHVETEGRCKNPDAAKRAAAIVAYEELKHLRK